MTEFEKETIKLATDKIFACSFFDITRLKTLVDAIYGPYTHRPEYAYLATLHCVHWDAMTEDFRKGLKEYILNIIENK